MKTLLFVCTGNTCRSPMAEALFRHRIGPGTEWRAASAGICAAAGAPASAGAVAVMQEMGIDLAAHRSRPLTMDLVRKSDLIIVMTAEHRYEILRDFPEVGNKVFLIKSFGTSRVSADISDPFGSSPDGYRNVRDEIDRALSDLIIFLRTGR